jgi:hypothetical protein
MNHLKSKKFKKIPEVFLTCDEYEIKEVLSNFPAFYGTRRFNTAFTTARHLSLS